MREANALQMLLDGCRRCYWIVREKDSVDTFSLNGTKRPVGEVNSLVDELLVVLELLIGAASPSLAADDVRCLIGFLVDCPQPNQNLVSKSWNSDHASFKASMAANIERMISAPENQLVKNLGGISFSITADSARNNVYNIDDGDGIVVGILSLLGALVTNGHLKIVSNTTTTPSGNILSTGPEGGTMFDDKVSLLLFALQKAFQAAPRKLMTTNVYTALLGATGVPEEEDAMEEEEEERGRGRKRKEEEKAVEEEGRKKEEDEAVEE
ncbi:hypothetical protein B296_00035169 [Ensete ventricosum]|uniref:DUF4704 domain-containing protein n=1 Tax=Ensete ventricosum TaxID=4639 RepID=A0A426ZV32_ENSVE|nr:hypothetical protein B296_00035169 [Ensete ventricosum]